MNRRKLFSSLAVTAILARAAARRADAAAASDSAPAGRMPDNQAFGLYTSPAGFSVRVPEGWARREVGRETIFSDMHNRIALMVSPIMQVPPLDLSYATAVLAPDIERSDRAVQVTEISEVTLQPGRTVKIAYDANGLPNEITNRSARLENERFYYAKNGRLVILSLTAPKGADNVDQWKRISASFRWT